MQLPRPRLTKSRLARPLYVPLSTLGALAGFIRSRLEAIAPVWPLRDSDRRALPGGYDKPEIADTATAMIAAAAPFAPTSFARARLLRQMHACGLLTDQESARAGELLGVAQSG